MMPSGVAVVRLSVRPFITRCTAISSTAYRLTMVTQTRARALPPLITTTHKTEGGLARSDEQISPDVRLLFDFIAV